MVNGVRPLALSKKLTIQVLGSVKLVQRILARGVGGAAGTHLPELNHFGRQYGVG